MMARNHKCETAARVDRVRINYRKMSGIVEVQRGKQFAILHNGRHGEVWSTRSGVVRFADGSEYEAVLELCDTDSGELWGTAIWTDKGLVWQNKTGFLKALGKTREQVFPYTYRYHGHIPGDHHGETK